MLGIQQKTIYGIPAAPGLTHGKTVILKKVELVVPEYGVKDISKEIERLDRAIEISQDEIHALKATLIDEVKGNEAEIFEAHWMFLEDEALVGMAKQAIEQGVNAEKGWMDAVDYYAQMMEQIPDETLSARAADIRDVGQRVLSHLLGVKLKQKELSEPSIVVAVDLLPSDTVSLNKDFVLAFCTAEGGPTSHTAVLAKTFGFPAVVGLGQDILELPEGTMVLVDGTKGVVVVNPDEETQITFITQETSQKNHQEEARLAAQEPALTADNERVEIAANIGGEQDAPFGIKYGAEGVGLFRTEFLYLDRKSLPTEEEQVEAYVSVFKHYPNMPVVVRTLDIGGDKVIPYLKFPQEMNPFLGWRGIRMMDGEEELFLNQFRTLLQAGELADVDLRIMMPMVACVREVREGKALLEKAKTQLIQEGKPCKQTVQLGIMVEVPSAALLADQLAKEVDFFSIGTNDLTQYTMAVDRTNSKVAHIGNPFNPAVLRLIKMTIDNAHAQAKWVGMCGEMAGEPIAAPILLGLGLDEFSMAPTRIPEIKMIMRALHKEDCQQLARDVLESCEANEVIALSKAFLSNLGFDY